VRRLAFAALALTASVAGAQSAPAPGSATEDPTLRAAADRGSVRALLQLADLRSTRGDLAGAAEPLRKAVALAPNSEQVLAAYARTAMAARAPGQALLALDPLARMNPTVMEYSYLLGVAWIQLGDAASALPPLERARTLQPRRALTLAALGIALNQQKRYGEAKELLDQALRLTRDDAEILAALGEAELGLGNRATAAEHGRRALELMPGHSVALMVVAMVEMEEQQYAEARQALEGVVAADPESAKAHYQLSLACARLGDRDCAAREIERYQASQRAAGERIARLREQSLENTASGAAPP
jgi:tetratricopeptide (TPR) repeat protein